MTIRYVIIDDEPLAHKTIEQYAERIDWLEYAGGCYDAIQALNLLHQQEVDLLFLDIRMPQMSGFEFLNILKPQPAVIITSAFREHALQSYEYDVKDYLLKPFSFDRFVKALHKIPRIHTSQSTLGKWQTAEKAYILVKEDRTTYKIEIGNIHLIEAYGNYVKVHLPEKFILSHKSLSYYEALLEKQGFVRIHKSFVIHLKKIQAFTSNTITIQGREIPIGKLYKKLVQTHLKEV